LRGAPPPRGGGRGEERRRWNDDEPLAYATLETVQRMGGSSGITDIWDDLRRALKLRTKDQAKRYIQPYVKRRHQIVHEADVYKSYRSHHKMRPITRPFTRQCVAHIKRFIEALNTIIDSKIQGKYKKKPQPAV